jgi:hypothetical protein
MIRKSGSRFSEKIMLKQQSKARLLVSADIARFRCKRAAWQGPHRPGRAIADFGPGPLGQQKTRAITPGFFELSR